MPSQESLGASRLNQAIGHMDMDKPHTVCDQLTLYLGTQTCKQVTLNKASPT